MPGPARLVAMNAMRERARRVARRLPGFDLARFALRYRPRRTLIWAGGTTMLGQVAVAVIGLVTIRTLTGLASPAVFGEANLLLSGLALATTLAVSPLTNTQLRYHTRALERGEADSFTRETLNWVLVATTAIVGLSLASYAGWRLFGGRALSPLVPIAATIWLYATSLRTVFLSRMHAERRQTRYVVMLVVEAAFLLATTVIALRIQPSTGSYVMGQALSPVLLVGVIALAAPWPLIGPKPRAGEGDFLRSAWSYGAPFAPIAALSWLANQADRYTLAGLSGAAITGQYVAAFSIASRGMNMTNAALNDVMRPILFEAANRGDEEKSTRVFAAWLLARLAMSLVAVGVLALLGPLISRLLLAPEYRGGAVGVMIWIGGAYAVNGLTQTLETRLMSLDHTSKLVAPLVVGAAGNVILSVVLVPVHGAQGAAQATFGSFAVQFAVTALVLWRALNRRNASKAAALAS